MEKEELQNIINLLETGNSKDDAYFGIFEYGGGSDESYIKANKQGLELFAADLLKASRDSEEIVLDNERDIYSLDYGEEWIDDESGTFIQYVELIIEKRKKEKKKPYKETWKDDAAKIGCIGGVLIIAISIVVGLITMISWLL
ncbi:hypothetical protein DMA11_12325 [Marinilabiliaceae bacterium JC017]|nr:hypothetical protein DMA11_12325 [Marinilabiliaceae bacterium JC017]